MEKILKEEFYNENNTKDLTESFQFFKSFSNNPMNINTNSISDNELKRIIDKQSNFINYTKDKLCQAEILTMNMV